MDPYIGEIRMFAGTFAPKGWANCNGALMSIAQNSALFSLLGTLYGGDGQVTFGLPDLRGRGPICAGSGPGLQPYQVGEFTGTESVTILNSQMPMHTHLVNGVSAAADQSTPGGFLPALSNDPAAGTLINSYSDAAADSQMAATMLSVSGGSQPLPIRNPVLAVTFIIATEGIYPSRP